jgi:hypothetical protein
MKKMIQHLVGSCFLCAIGLADYQDIYFLNIIQIFEILVIASLKIQLFIAKSMKKYSFKRFCLKKTIINLQLFFS